jgi:hypothetical protein
MGQTLGLYEVTKEESDWKSLTKYKEHNLIYVRDKNKSFWIGDKLERLQLPISPPVPLVIDTGTLYPRVHQHYSNHYQCEME